ncbi:PAS domain S-box protein [Reichenbachiella ulvae]|uniref:PAS domain S-box protein n=1 Tax=Reichenbachiella ulvae TaxID=2980104 RepID=A0ABT3CNU9_9BACT|nr:PAS domain S-box protein [Reichenbachiella ulvae]MCV9385204.1 PAS domain S-box protein [Reichenbachiella ulvae]
MSTKTIKPKASKNGVAEETNGHASLEQLTEQLKDANQNYNTILSSLEMAVDSIIMMKSDKNVTFMNKSAEKMFGFDREEVIGKNVKMLVPTEHRSNHDKYVDNNIKTGKNKVVGLGRDLEMTRRDGSKFWGNLSLSKVEVEGEYYFTAFIKDITQQREDTLAAGNIKSAVDTAWASIEFEPDGTILNVNDNWIDTLGYDKSEMIGHHHRMFCDPEYAKSKEYKDFWKNLAAGQTMSGEFRRFKNGGEEIWINASYTPVRDNNGEVYKVIKIASDITEQKIKNSDFEGQLAAIGKAQAVIEFNLDGTIVKANENFLKTVGYSINEIEGKHHKIFCDPSYARSADYAAFWDKLNSGEYVTGEFERITKSGETIWLQAAYNPIMDMNGKPYKVVKFATDVTAQKQAMQELNRVVTSVSEEGNLSERANYNEATGAELELLQSINSLLEGIGIPIMEISKVISDMAKGDLTSEVNIECKGDVKAMADGLTTAMTNLNELLGDINESSNLIASSSEQMLVKSDQMQGTTAQVASAIGQMAEGVHDQAAQIDESSRLINNVRTSAETVGEQSKSINEAAKKGQENAKKGLGTVKKVVESMTEIQRSADITSDSIEVLTQRSEEIARTLNVITDIAGQTNLLALNAAIEAARAGDAGRGFAVVAEEIRKLAEDSRTSAGDIEKVIKAVEKDIMQAGKAIGEMGSSVKSGNEASKEAETVFVAIDESVIETLSLSEQVLSASEGQKTSIDETVKNIEKIVVVAEETSSGTEEIATSAKDLSNGMTEFNSSSQGLADIANQLRSGVSKFTLKSL